MKGSDRPRKIVAYVRRTRLGDPAAEHGSFLVTARQDDRRLWWISTMVGCKQTHAAWSAGKEII